jgi:hypothetical protein
MSKGKSTTTTTTDPAQMAIYQDLYGKAQGIASQPFVPYTGARVAGFNPDQITGFDATRGMFNQSMSFDPRNNINNLINMPAPSVSLPFGYSQPQQPSPIFQPVPAPGGGGSPTPPPSIGGPGGGGPVFTSPDPRASRSVGQPIGGYGPDNNPPSSINFQNDERFGQPITTRIGRNGQEIPVYGFHNNVSNSMNIGAPLGLPPGTVPQPSINRGGQGSPAPGGGVFTTGLDELIRAEESINSEFANTMRPSEQPIIPTVKPTYRAPSPSTSIGTPSLDILGGSNVPGGGGIDYGPGMGGGLFSGGPVVLPPNKLPETEKDFQNISIEDRLKMLTNGGISNKPASPTPVGTPPLDRSGRQPILGGGNFPAGSPSISNPSIGINPGTPSQRINAGPFSSTQLAGPAMQEGVSVGPAQTFGGATINNLATFGGANISPIERFGAATISPINTFGGSSINRGDVRNVTPKSLLDTDLGAYQNPFQEEVINNTLDDLNRARQLQIQSDQDAAIGRGAFGGSRSALLESETNRNFAEQAARTAGDLRAQGFDRATNLAGQDIGRSFDANRFMAGIDRDIASQNAGFGQQAGLAAQGLLGDIVRDQARLNQQAGLAGMDAENRRRFQEGMFRQEAGINDANTFNRAAMQNAGFAQEAGMANMAAKNRFGLTQAELDANRFAANQNASNTFGLRQGDFDNAMNMGMFDAANRAAFMQPQLEMQNRGFQAGLLGGQLSDQYRSLGLLSGIGSQQQGLGQAGLDAGYGEFMRALGYGPQQLGLLAQGVSALPNQTNTTSSNKPGTLDQLAQAAAIYSGFGF